MSAAIVPLQLADFSASSGTETTPTGYGSSQSGRVLATIHQFAMCSSFFSCSCFVFVFVLLLVLVLVGGWRWRLCLCLWLCRSYGRLQEKGYLKFIYVASAKIGRILLRGHCGSLRAETGTFELCSQRFSGGTGTQEPMKGRDICDIMEDL